MVFCGKCGFQLTSGYITCPRCGTPAETEIPSDASQPDSPTIAASTIQGGMPSHSGSQEAISPGRPREQQPLILGSPQPGDGSMEQRANEATNMMGTQYPTSAQNPREQYTPTMYNQELRRIHNRERHTQGMLQQLPPTSTLHLLRKKLKK